jgi:hypothetical protein
MGDVPSFALIPRNWTSEYIEVDYPTTLVGSASYLYYARLIAPYVEVGRCMLTL